MKATEAAALLTIAAAYDNRKPDADQARAWAMVLDGYTFEDCREVVVTHFRASREWMMPADIIAGVKKLRARRLADFGKFPEPPAHIDPDNTGALARWRLETQTAIADGTYTPEPSAAITGPRRDVIRELGQVQSIDAAEATKPLRQAHAEAKRVLQEAAAEKKRTEEARRAAVDAARADLPAAGLRTNTTHTTTKEPQ